VIAMDLQLVSTPLTLNDKTKVVTVPEIRRHARITDTGEDRQIAEDIEAAYDFLAGPDGWLGRCSLLTEEWIAYVGHPDIRREFTLPMRPFREFVGFDFRQSDGTYLPVSPSIYLYDNLTGFARFARSALEPWPYFGTPHDRAYRFRFRSGFGTTRESIPSPIRKSIKMLAAHWFNQRETIGSEGRTPGKEVEYGLKALCGRYRIGPDHS
jgi:uncharacterized phiE125 gp8 family phage protein